MSVYVWPGVFHFTQAAQNTGHNVKYFPNYFYYIIVANVFFGKFHLGHKAGVWSAQYRVTITGHHLSFGQSSVYVICDLFFGRRGCTQFFEHIKNPFDHFLIGQAVQRTGQGVHPCGKGQIGIAEGRPHQMGGMSRGVSTFVIGVDG